MRLTTVLPSMLTALALTGCDESSSERPAPAPEPPAQPSTPTAAEPEGPANPLGLPDDLSAALRREMLALEPAMAQLQSSIARGRSRQAAETATQIHDSYILKQELTAEQLETLVSSLPDGFIQRDRAFHQTASALAHAAEAGEMAEAARLYGDMATACVGCHAEHASTRFPGLAGVSVPMPAAPAPAEGEAHAH